MDEDSASSSAAQTKKVGKQHNTLPFWGNEASMNLNPLILANIQSSSYFKVHLFKLKTYHEVVDEIYYQVKHMEPWERGSRKTSGQTGMCGGVRGVGAGGIVSTAYCLLYKLYTLRLTRKQVNGLLNHTDSPYIRALGFMYLRYTQPPGDLYEWYEDYLQDEEEIDVKAGGGQVITVGQMVYQFMTKLDWFSTLFPRIPVPMQKQTERKLEQYCRENGITINQLSSGRGNATSNNEVTFAGSVALETHGAGAGAGGGGGGSNSRNASGSGDRRDRDRATGSRSAAPPSTSYRTEHDERDRDYYNYQSSSSTSRRRGDYSPSTPTEKERHRSKHKKKHKHRHYSRSRSRSRSQSRSSHHERRREREYYYDRYEHKK